MKKILLPLVLTILLASAVAPAFADDVVVSGDVDKAISVTFNYDAVGFGTITEGTLDNAPDPAYTTGEYNVTVDTNFAWRVKVNGTDFDDGGGHTFGMGNLTVDSNAVAGSLVPTTAVTGSPATLDSYSTTGEGIDNFHGYLLDVPSYQYASSYSSTVTWTYENQ
jgi:hypothetical protein